ncbi:hypothetical protein D3C81_1465600 [compost metagenome]
MLRRHAGQQHALGQRHALPPVDLLHVAAAAGADQLGIAQAGDHPGVGEAPGQLGQAVQVEVVVMVVADQDQVDRRQLVQRQPRRMVAAWAEEAERAGALAP